MSDVAEIKLNGDSYSLPVVVGTENEKALDITKLRGQSGLITIDSGFKNTGSTQSAITFLDGENGVLRYRGYPIEQLADHSNFVEVAYLLIYGELPKKDELEKFQNGLSTNSLVREELKGMFAAFPTTGHPMGLLSSLVSALSAYDEEALDPYRAEEKVNETIVKLIAQLPTLIAWTYKRKRGETYIYPNAKHGYTQDFVRMMFAPANDEYEVDEAVVRAIDKLLILHADHEQNCSTSTVRLVGSSHANLYASISAGIGALWGPLHGGANQKVIEMLEQIREDGGDLNKWLDKAKDKNDPFRLMGFGHRVYKNFDPRATIIKSSCDEILSKLGINDPALELAKKMEETALSDPYFAERKLYPNVDFYSGVIYRALGIPVEFFTVMFALGRLPGWIAQWREMLGNGEPIGRPRQVYVGSNKRDYVAADKR